ncbi:hypothetical protein NX784_18435 [Massilia pinisoli]|uniref:Uncharacterized protein n=1 Tax=Massilia pinisoli TaxID=1772194 RepID=A0ABT1ZUH4_9BURK|nr:hypothetical protein [Massilia pinisoli]MCS0583573.1 hypothetical protein [Massilia pinisoli]
MAAILNIIDTLCEQVQGQKTNKPAPAFFRQHIFHAILDYCSRGEPCENRIDMMHRFDQFEKCVASIKRRESRQIQHWLDAIHGRELNLATDLARIGMSSLYYPALALHDYFKGNHETALHHLDISLNHFSNLFDQGFGEAIFGMVEQNLNKVRVLVAAKRNKAAIDETLDLLDFLYADRGGAKYKHEKLAAHCEADKHDSLVAHYLDELLIKFITSEDGNLVGTLLTQLYERCDSWAPGNVKNALSLLQRCRFASDGGGNIALSEYPLSFRSLPFSLQYVLALTLISRSECELNATQKSILINFLSLSSTYKRVAKTRWYGDTVEPKQTSTREPKLGSSPPPDSIGRVIPERISASLGMAC